jgi:hypothetical protein
MHSRAFNAPLVPDAPLDHPDRSEHRERPVAPVPMANPDRTERLDNQDILERRGRLEMPEKQVE